MSSRQSLAVAALLLGAVAIALACAAAIGGFPRGLSVLACLLVAAASGWFAALRRGPARLAGFAIAVLGFGAAIALVVVEQRIVEDLVIVVVSLLAVAAARRAFAPAVDKSAARPPQRPVMFYNPRSGGGKAESLHLADQARARGIEPIELRPGDDLETLVRNAVASGADALAMAGGDGSQATVAAVAAESGLPYACIPAGTRNHFALDLGVDRTDVVGALDAFVDGIERRVDLSEVNGRVFVNNVSLGLYAEAVRKAGYRDAKLRTLIDTVPEVLGPQAPTSGLRCRGPGGGEYRSPAAMLVSNNSYRLGGIGAGTRPRLDRGLLGIAEVAPPPRASARQRLLGFPLRSWSAAELEVDAGGPLPAGIDGESATLDPPLRFHTLHRALRVRIARRHPGCSPSAGIPDRPADGIRSLLRIALGRD